MASKFDVIEVSMECFIEGCNRESYYKVRDVCLMHHTRFRRHGKYESTRVRKYRLTNPSGYQKLNKPDHPLVNADGYIYEHRYQIFKKYGYEFMIH